MSEMLPVEIARERMLADIKPLGVERVSIFEARGAVLAEDVFAAEDNPPFDNSAMDGYAVIAADLQGASQANPIRLKVVERIPAGHAPTETVARGNAARIMTGAMTPDGADAVVMIEHTATDGDAALIMEAPIVGQNIRRRGESVRAGDRVLAQGKTIRPAEMAMLAALNVGEVPVHRRPKVAVISTGDELTELRTPLMPGKIRDSNRYGLYGQIEDAGGVPVDLGIAADDEADVERKVRQGLRDADALVTSGGVSVGDHDVVKDVLLRLGELSFWRVAMKPGKPQAYGSVLGKPVFALPGNPVSSLVVFELFVRPALRKMAGHSSLFRATGKATLEESVRNDARGRVNYMRVVLTEENGHLTAKTTGTQSSGVLRSLILANGLAIIGDEGASAGDIVDVIFTDRA